MPVYFGQWIVAEDALYPISYNAGIVEAIRQERVPLREIYRTPTMAAYRISR